MWGLAPFGPSLVAFLAQVPLAILLLPISATAGQNHSSGNETGTCLVGDRGDQRLELNITRDSLCCIAAEFYLARRPGGYCPNFIRSRQLPFSVNCAIDDGLGGAYVPDVATFNAAKAMLCDIKGCAAEVAAVIMRAAKTSVWETAPPMPQCTNEVDKNAGGIPVKRVALAGALAFGAVAVASVLHFIITPWWIRVRVQESASIAGPIPHRECTGANVQLGDVAVCFDSFEENGPSPPSVSPPPLVLGLQLPSPDAVVAGSVVSSNINEKRKLDASHNEFDPEALALEGFVEARARCRAHIGLFTIIGFVTILCRLVLIVATTPPMALALLAILAFCVWQLSALARIACSPLLVPKMDTCAACAGDLRIYAGTTFVCEFLVLCFAMGLFYNSPGIMVEEISASNEPKSIKIFILEQAAISFVLVRLYIAWVALGLHKLRRDLTFAILPESSNVEGSKLNSPEFVISQPVDLLVAPWEPELTAADPKLLNKHAAAKRCARFRAILVVFITIFLVLLVAGIVIWRAHTREQNSHSSCSTAARGLDFCVRTDYLGLSIETNSMEECCALCDVTAGCSAWSFVRNTEVQNNRYHQGRCWRMQFTEAPCDKNPEHFSCRCHTTTNRFGGYRTS